MGLISGMFMGILSGIALMAGWQYMMRYRSNKRIAKVLVFLCFNFFCSSIFFVKFTSFIVFTGDNFIHLRSLWDNLSFFPKL